jgi:hypothetical protein
MAEKELVRGLTAGELNQARWMFGDTVNFTIVQIHRGKYAFWQPDNTAMAPNGHVYFPAPIYHADFSINASTMWLLIHELTHVWQVQSGVWLKFRRVVLEGGVYDYGQLSPTRELQSYTVEQQGSIVADWFRLRHRLGAHHGSGALANYEAVVRRAIPAADR